MCLRIGTPKTINFPFVPNGKLNILGVPIFTHIRKGKQNNLRIILNNQPYVKLCITAKLKLPDLFLHKDPIHLPVCNVHDPLDQ